MPRSKKILEQIKNEKKQQILQSALELFARKGYHATSVDQIAQKAKISKGLIYNYFKSKKDILLTLVNSLFEQMDLALPQVKPSKLTEEDIERYILTSMQALEQNPQNIKLYFMLYMQPDIEELVKPLVENYIDKIVNFLSPYYKSRGIHEPRSHILSLIASLDGLSLHYILLQYPEYKEIIKTIIQKFVYI